MAGAGAEIRDKGGAGKKIISAPRHCIREPSPVSHLSVLCLLSHNFCPLSHVPSLTAPVSRLLSEVCLLFHVFCLTSSISRLLSPVSCLLSHVSSLSVLCLLSNNLCLLSHMYCLTYTVSCLLSQVSCLLSCQIRTEPI